MHRYRVWRHLVGETEAGAFETQAIHIRHAAETCATLDHPRAGFEWTWPQTYRVKEIKSGALFDVVVERESVPEFRATSARAVK